MLKEDDQSRQPGSQTDEIQNHQCLRCLPRAKTKSKTFDDLPLRPHTDDELKQCLGGRPCPPCASSNTLCIYEEETDRRRRVYTEKARAEVNFQRRLLDGLLNAIRGENCDKVLEMIRANGSMQDLAAQLDMWDDTGNPICRAVNADTEPRSLEVTQRSSDESSLASHSLLPSSTSFSSSSVTSQRTRRSASYCTSEGRQEETEERLPSFSELIASTHSPYEMTNA